MPKELPPSKDQDGAVVRWVTYAVAAAVVGVGFVVLWITKAGYEEFGVSLATTLIASALFAVLYTTSSEKALRALFQAYLARATTAIVAHSQMQMQQLGAQLLGEADHLNSAFRPDKCYPESDAPQPGHNADLTGDLSRSGYYYFRGLTGRWVPRRIARYGGTLNELWLVLTLPTVGDDALVGAMNRHSYSKYESLNDAARAAQVREDIFGTVIAAFTLIRRTQITVRVAYEPAPSALRAELFESAVYRSTYLPQDSQKRFPTVYRFPNRTEMYRDTAITFRQQALALKDRVRFDDATTEDDVLEHLRGLGFAGGLTELRRLGDKYWAWADEDKEQ